MKGNLKRFLAALLALTLVFSFVPPVVQADAATTTSGQRGPIGLTAQNGNTAEEITFAESAKEETQDAEESAFEDTGLTKFEPTEQERFSEKAEELLHDEDDLVTFIVVTEQKPQLELFSVSEIAAQTSSVQKHLSKQEKALNAVQAAVKSAFGKEAGFELGYTYTVATTGFAVTTAFGNKAELEAIEGVKSVYEAPVFSLPVQEDAQTMTNNATTMIGADIVNGTGYTGKGMRVAILDTGLRVDHPNFAALSEDKLEDPMTRESVEAVWSTLNAGQMTNKLNTSYLSTKLPFVFNYDAGTFDVDNAYAGNDHGTHVAGIAAANKVDGSNVIGVAPDAQVVVMQVFQSNGGASWATIMAALEDCVRLEVDAANLSLGSAAGFTDPDDEMLDTLALFLDTDIQVLIASGNDTHNAYQNAWGLNMNLITDPDIGVTGTPASYSAALCVASVDNDGYELLYFTVDGKNLGFQDTATASSTIFINNFRNQSLEYVVVPGVGEAADYEGLDVEGKIALVSRGTISFPEKQQIAQSLGAAGVVIYNNTVGLFQMQINDGNGSIPCVSIDRAAGLHMIEAAGEDGIGSMTVCNADTKTFNVDRTVSSFSSWGVTPDLKLKPEISGVGGDIYATRDPDLAGSYYGSMSGTSMATPQVTGAMAVLIQYLDENYPEITGSAQRVLAANLLMSTAEPLMATTELEYSPRAQGAGLANLINATSSPAYLSNSAASETRPKIEFGDDPSKSGVYNFSFQISNLSDEALTYTFDSSVLTEAIYEEYFIANSPYGLEAEVETPDQVTVPANGTVTVNATLTLTANDKAYLDKFPNGIYVEGYLYANPVIEGDEGVQGVTLTMPMVGFYGDWSDAPVFDDPVDYSLYPTVIYTYYSQLGYNPYFRNGKSGEEYNAVSYANPIDEIDFGMMRNAKRLDIKVTDKVTGEVYHTLDGSYMPKTYFSNAYGMIVPTMIMSYYGETWDGKTANGKTLPSGTAVTYSFEAWLDDGDDVMDDSWSFDMVLDNAAPELLNEDDLQASLRMDTESGRSYLTLQMQDNHYIAALIFQAPNGAIMGKYEIDAAPGETFTGEYEITGFGSEFTIILADYACNESEIEVLLDLGDQNNAVPEAAPLSPDRIYGSETFDSAIVEAGWFSVDKDYTDIRNETYDSPNRYYAAEYVNGYIIGQSTNTGNLELITPTGSYWGSQTLCENAGRAGDPNVWIFYDMALDHSGTLAEKYGLYQDATDSLWAVGWMYAGDQDNDGKDDGYNALFNISFQASGYVNVNPVARISGLDNEDLLTLGITTEGKMYGIGTNGILYAVSDYRDWDSNAGQYGDYIVRLEEIGETSFVNYPGYGGANVIQSMGYDHNTGTMYWFAHSQVPSGYSYANINVTYEVDLETGECTEVGTFGPGGQTSLFVPNDLQSDLFTLGVDATGMSIDPYSMTLVDGQTARMKIKWTPWNATPVDVTWSSSDESIATVDEYGFVTAHAAGTVSIYASAEMLLDGYWEVLDNGDWVWRDPGMGTKTVSATVNVLASEDALYGYVIEDFGNADNSFSWVTYSDKDLHDITVVGKQFIEGTEALWYGGTYYNGYVWTTLGASWIEDDVIYTGTQLYKSKVTTGETAADLTIGEPELVGVIDGMEITAMGFDYNTGRMYCVENKYVGGLGIIDLETAEVDMLGAPNGDLAGNVYIPGLCVTADGTIVISDAVANLYTIDPDTLTTKQIHSGNGSASTAFYEGMTYDHNTGSIYWNMCDGNGASPLYLVILPEDEWSSATVVDLGGVSTKNSVQQTVLFTVPENEPETKFLPVESIEITNGETLTGLEGGSLQLNTLTVPARPTLQKKTWTSSDESVVTVDEFGVMRYVGLGTATVTVSITNKDEAAHGGPFTDSIEVTVLEAAGEFVAFLNADENATGYFDFWLRGNDYDLRHTAVEDSMIAIYSLRAGTYYDGYYYGYNDGGSFMRINADNPKDFKYLGTANMDYYTYQVTAMAMDYTTGTMYGLTLPSNYDYSSWASEEHPGELVTIDLDTGKMTTVATLDFATPVFALACDAEGQLYAAGGSFDYYGGSNKIFKMDKATGELTEYTTVEGACMFTGSNYYGYAQYNPQMTYDFGTNRLYLNATVDEQYYYKSYGMYMVQLGDEPTVAKLDGISLDLRGTTKYGDVYLGLLAFIPEESEIPVNEVNGIILNTTSTRVAVGETTQLTAKVRPANAADPSVTWSVADESIATVDGSGLITGVSVGTTTVTVTSNETGVSAVCRITVIEVDGPQSVAYTVSANKDALISFNPEMPAQTAEVVCTLSGGSTIKGVAYGDNCLYYAQEEGSSYFLYRFDFTTKKSTELGILEAWAGVDGIAYDAENNLLYAVGGFYLFQYDLSKCETGGYNASTNYVMDSDYCTLTGVAVVDGAVYTFGNDYYNSTPQMMRYSDKYLGDRTVVASGFDFTFVPGSTDVGYDPNAGLFYLADAGHVIYSMDMDGSIVPVDVLGDGIDIHGIAIDPVRKYQITYTDGVEDAEVFADQKFFAAPEAKTPDFVGTPAREGYTFAGWTPEVAESVAGDASYAAVWTANTYSLVLKAEGGVVDPAFITVTYGQPIGELPVPVREGYIFEGWFDAQGNEVTAETIYTWAGMTSISARWTAEEGTTVIDAPVITASNNAKTGKIKLTWDAVEGAVQYKVYRATKKDGEYKLMYTLENTTYTNTKATAGKYYYYYVVAIAEDGTVSAPSNIAGRTCNLETPVVTASNVAKTGKVRLTWDAVEGAVEYKIYRATAKDGKYSLMYTTENTTYINTKAEAGVTYYYKVVAVAAKTAANSAASSIVSRTCDLPQVKVTGKVTLLGNPKLTWEKVDGAVSYKVYRATSANGEYKLMKTVTGTSYANTNHVNGTTYYYYVVAVAENTWANSAASNVVKLTAK